MSKTELHEPKNDFNCDNEEEIDHRLRRQIRQLESDHKVEKAVLEQKIELLEVRLGELEERETDLKKKNSEILQILSDLNKKEDSALMNKVFEELELANNEKLQEKIHQQSKVQAIKDQLELNINELKKKLEQSETEKQELEARYNSQLLKHQRELEHERRAYEEIKKELEERMHHTRRGEELDRLRKMFNVLEQEKESLKKEYEKEMNKMKFGFERNLAELKKIHNEERHSFENRLKKMKDIVVKERKEYEAKRAVESHLSQEISELKEKIVQIEAKYAFDVEKITKEKNVALEKAKELEKSFDEFKASSHRFKTPCNNTERFMRNLEERLKVLEQKDHIEQSASKAHPVKEESRNALHDSQSEVLLSDPVQCWNNDEHVKLVCSKQNTRSNSRNDLNYISQPQSSTYCYSEVDNHGYPEKGDVQRNDSQQDYLESIMDDYSILKDTSQLRGNYSQSNIKRQNWLTEEKYRMSYTNDNSPNGNLSLQTTGKEAWNFDKLHNIGGYKSPIGVIGVRVPVNYPRGVYLKNEGPMLRRNGSQGQLGSSLRRDLSSEKLDVWRDCNITTIKEMQKQSDPNGNPYKKGIQDVISGLSNIKSRLEKQQQDTLVSKTENSTEMSRRTRSFSNVRLRPSALPTEILNTTSFYNESNYRPYEHSKIHITPITTTELSRNIYRTADENSANLSQYGERESHHIGYSSMNFQPNSRTRVPTLKREGVRIDFQSRHRNSLA